MLKKLIGYFNSIKKDPGRNKGYSKWNKEKLQGINSGVDKAENKINNLEDKEEKNKSELQGKKKTIKKN